MRRPGSTLLEHLLPEESPAVNVRALAHVPVQVVNTDLILSLPGARCQLRTQVSRFRAMDQLISSLIMIFQNRASPAAYLPSLVLSNSIQLFCDELQTSTGWSRGRIRKLRVTMTDMLRRLASGRYSLVRHRCTAGTCDGDFCISARRFSLRRDSHQDVYARDPESAPTAPRRPAGLLGISLYIVECS